MTCLVCQKGGAKWVRLLLSVPTEPIRLCERCQDRWRDLYGITSEVLTPRKPGVVPPPSGSRAATAQHAASGQRAA